MEGGEEGKKMGGKKKEVHKIITLKISEENSEVPADITPTDTKKCY